MLLNRAGLLTLHQTPNLEAEYLVVFIVKLINRLIWLGWTCQEQEAPASIVLGILQVLKLRCLWTSSPFGALCYRAWSPADTSKLNRTFDVFFFTFQLDGTFSSQEKEGTDDVDGQIIDSEVIWSKRVYALIIPAFSVKCTADIFCLLYFYISTCWANETDRNPPITAHRTFELVANLRRSDIKQTPACSGCDWLISNSTWKGDVERWISKDNRYAGNTESWCKTQVSLNFWAETEAHSMVKFWIQLRRTFQGKLSSQVKIEFEIMHILVKIGIFIISKYVFEVF